MKSVMKETDVLLSVNYITRQKISSTLFMEVQKETWNKVHILPNSILDELWHEIKIEHS
jgi:hypothetical protein